MDALFVIMDKGKHDKESFCIGILLIDGFPLLSYASVVEPLRAANTLAGDDLYIVKELHASAMCALSSSGVSLNTSPINRDDEFDLLLVVAGGDPSQFDDQKVFNWLRRLSRFGIQMGGISGGPIILALAGVIQDRRMTVHWEHIPALEEVSPSLVVERSLYVIDRDCFTCAGGTAAIDLMHAIIAGQHGTRFARLVNDWLLHTDRPSDAPQRAGRIERYGTTNHIVLQAIEMMENHIADPLELGELADVLDISTRQLNRLFKAKLGHSTMAFYRNTRLEKALELIKNSSLRITEIALATGFSNSSHFSTSYTQIYGVPPSQHRS